MSNRTPSVFDTTFRTVGVVLSVSAGAVFVAHPGISAPAKPARKPVPGAAGVRPRMPIAPPAAPDAGDRQTAKPAVDLYKLPAPTDEFMPLSQVKPGMKGYGLTVFRGTKIERFGVEVLGVMEKSYMGRPLVLVRLSGGPISERGAFLIQGMSGSPIYLDGKLLGAFSMGNAWPKDPIGMVTPIDDMMEALDPKLSQIPAGGIAFDPAAPVANVASTAVPELFRTPLSVASPAATGRTFRPLSLPVTVSGLSGRNLEAMSEVLRPFNLNVMQGAGSVSEPIKTELGPGSAVGVALVRGDIEMTAFGTVTHRKGNELVAFGHPFFQIGAVQFPMTTAWVHEVFSGFDVSHKISSAGEVIGTIIQDRPFSIAGKVGPAPKMIPVRYTVKDQTTGRGRTYQCEAINHPLLVGRFLPVAVNQGLFEVRPVPGEAVAQVKLRVETDGAGTITRENIFFDPAAIDITAVSELMELMNVLSANSFQKVPIKSVDVDVVFEEKRPTATVERIFLPQDKFEPGDEIEVGVVLRPFRKDPVLTKTKIRVPESAANGRALLMVHGGSTRVNLSSLSSGSAGPGGVPQTGAPADATLGQVLKRFQERERNDQLITRLVFPSTSVAIQGSKLSQLPSPLVEVMRSSKSTGFRFERDDAKAVTDSELILSGLQVLAIDVQRPDRQEKPQPGGASSGAGRPSTTGSATPMQLNSGFGNDDEEFAAGRVRFSVDGLPRVVRLTPEEDEPSRLKGDEKAPQKEEKKPAPAKNGAKQDPKAGAKPDDAKAADKPAEKADDKPNQDPLVGRQAKLWKQSTAAEFAAGTFKSTGVATTGDVRLTPSLKLAHESPEQFVWSVAGVGGAVYAGTGHGGQVLRLDQNGTASVFFRTGELEVHSLGKDAKGNLYVGTSPRGKVFRVSPDGKGEELLDLSAGSSDDSARFVVSLAVAADGTVYAGTGPEAAIYRVKPGAKGELLCKLPDQTVMSLHLGSDGALYAGTAEDGAIYRVRLTDASAQPEILYDSDASAITGLALAQDGTLYAAASPNGTVYKITPDRKHSVHFAHKGKGALYGLLVDGGGNLITATGDSVLRIERDGTATYLADPKRAQFTCVAWDEDGRIIAGSANVGSIYRLALSAEGSFESTVHDAGMPARWGRVRYSGMLPDGAKMQVETRSGNTREPDRSWSAWQPLASRDSGTYVVSPEARFLQYRVVFESAAGSPSLREIQFSYLPRNQAPKVTLAAPAAGQIIRGGFPVKWSAVDPDKDTLTYEVSFSADQGKTWKPVGETTAAAPAGGTPAPPSDDRPTRAEAQEALKRFREQLDSDQSLTPAQRDESFNKAKQVVEQYLDENPEPEKGESKPTPAPAAAASRPAGTTRQATLTWDTKSVPDGVYLVRVVASDKASNPGEPLADVALSEPFIVSNTPPQLFVFERGISVNAQKEAGVVGFASGRVSLQGAQYRVDGGDWTAIEPDDGIWDSASEHFRFTVPAAAAGEWTVEVKLVDVAGNSSTTKVKYKVP
ncbi:MAG: SMP-30/gluconolactonase/LRE family protein [Armatimonadota bacterium]